MNAPSTENNQYLKFLHAIAEGRTTRTEIAEYLDVSTMTAGKLAARLIDYGYLTQVRSQTASAGRRPMTLRFDDSLSVITVRIKPSEFVYSVFSLSLKYVCGFAVPYESSLFFDESFVLSLRESREYLKAKKKKPAAVCVITDDTDGIPVPSFAGLDSLNIKVSVKSVYGDVNTLINTSSYAETARGAFGDCSSGFTLIINLLHGRASSSILFNGAEYSQGIGNIGEYRVYPGRTLNDVLRYAKTPEETAAVLAPVIIDMINLLSPSRIIVRGESYADSADTVKFINDALKRDTAISKNSLPDVTPAEYDDGAVALFCAREVRETVLRDISFAM